MAVRFLPCHCGQSNGFGRPSSAAGKTRAAAKSVKRERVQRASIELSPEAGSSAGQAGYRAGGEKPGRRGLALSLTTAAKISRNAFANLIRCTVAQPVLKRSEIRSAESY